MKSKKKEYKKPEVKRVSLDVKCAVLAFCKTSGSLGPDGMHCGLPNPPCASEGSWQFEAIDTVKEANPALNTRSSSAGFCHFGDLSGELLSLGLGVRFRAPGTSMHPTIRHGEVITVEPLAPSKLKKGDIVLYRLRTGFIAHRIVNMQERDGFGLTFILRGDASTTCDNPVEPQQILGKVVCLERDNRILDPYSWGARLWSTVYLWLARLKRGVVRHWLNA